MFKKVLFDDFDLMLLSSLETAQTCLFKDWEILLSQGIVAFIFGLKIPI